MSKRKSYRPKAVISDPLSLLRPADKERANKVMARFFTALEDMTRGDQPGEGAWRDLSDAVNTIETLALHLRKLLADEVMPLVNAAITAMGEAANRYKAGKGMRLDAPGIQALRDVIDVYQQCLDGFTEREMAIAQALTQRRMNELLRSKKPTHEVVSL